MWKNENFGRRFTKRKRLTLIGYRKGIEILLSFIIVFRLVIIKGIFLLLLLLEDFRFLLSLL